MKTKWIFVVMSIAFGAGCATSHQIKEDKVVVNTADGVTRSEAIILAKQKLNPSEYIEDYDIKKPQVLFDFIEREYPQYWFVSFPLKDETLSSWTYLVVIDKENGKFILHIRLVNSRRSIWFLILKN